jgi:hypothetical protein
VLFVDEAAQMAIANVLAVSQAAKTVVLIGDPQQLDQPMQGSHPEGTDVSALDHILGGDQTIPTDKGLFLGETWRLHPAICAYTSEEAALTPKGREFLMWDEACTHEHYTGPSLDERLATFKIEQGVGPHDWVSVFRWRRHDEPEPELVN